MSEDRPAPLPEEFRKPEPEAPPTVGAMNTEQQGWVSQEALGIDTNWGCWLNPQAEVELMSVRSSYPPHRPVLVTKQPDGAFTVFLTRAAGKLEWGRTIQTSFKGWFPVREVTLATP